MASNAPFPFDALEANRAGRLSAQQQTWLRSLAKQGRSAMRSFALIAGALGLIVLFFADKAGVYRVLGGVALLIVAGFFLVRSLMGADLFDADLRAGKVESVEGAIMKRKWVERGKETSYTTYYIDVAGRSLVAFRDQYEAAPEAGWVRVYFVPRSLRVVNLEVLPDKAVPQGVTQSPKDLLKLAVSGLIGSEESQAEARANMAAIGHGMQAGAPPPASARDPRPLAEAIVGRWTNGMITLQFDPDGTATATLPGGMERTAHWSVDAQGRLVADLMGEQEAGDAWVAGDELSVTQGGSGFKFRRA